MFVQLGEIRGPFSEPCSICVRTGMLCPHRTWRALAEARQASAVAHTRKEVAQAVTATRAVLNRLPWAISPTPADAVCETVVGLVCHPLITMPGPFTIDDFDVLTGPATSVGLLQSDRTVRQVVLPSVGSHHHHSG